MGIKLNDFQREEILGWAKKFRVSKREIDGINFLNIKNTFYDELHKYGSAGQIASSKIETSLTKEIRKYLFITRIKLEKSIIKSVKDKLIFTDDQINNLYKQKFFGKSKKQGISFRISLTTCQPTQLCGNRCYAHDALDATPPSIIRGCLNYLLVKSWSDSDKLRKKLETFLDSELINICKLSISEANNSDYLRRPRIRLSHVGELTAFPEFTNYISKKIKYFSKNLVNPIIYTRHPFVDKLDSKYLVINFSIDDSTNHIINKLKNDVRYVCSAFDGKINENVEINFLEHHNKFHHNKHGQGKVCPVTNQSNFNSCDQAECDICFESDSIICHHIEK